MMSTRARFPVLLVALAAMVAAGPAFAQRGSLSGHAGYVDGSRLADVIPLDREEVEIVEVNLAGPLLRALTPMLNQEEPGLGEIVNELMGITAVVASGLDEKTTLQARDIIDGIARELQQSGWERLVRVREQDSRTLVFLHYSGDAVDGLTVLGFEGESVTFVNIAGMIDLASLSKLGETMNLPGLEEAAKAAQE